MPLTSGGCSGTLQWSPFRIEGETPASSDAVISESALQWSPFRIEGETRVAAEVAVDCSASMEPLPNRRGN